MREEMHESRSQAQQKETHALPMSKETAEEQIGNNHQKEAKTGNTS